MRPADFIIVGTVLFAGGFAARRAQDVLAELRGGQDKIDDSDFILNLAVVFAGFVFAAIGIVRIVTG